LIGWTDEFRSVRSLYERSDTSSYTPIDDPTSINLIPKKNVRRGEDGVVTLDLLLKSLENLDIKHTPAR
jgi:hypothetical protein